MNADRLTSIVKVVTITYTCSLVAKSTNHRARVREFKFLSEPTNTLNKKEKKRNWKQIFFNIILMHSHLRTNNNMQKIFSSQIRAWNHDYH